MFRTLVAASAFAVGLAGYAIAQETTPGSPAGNAPVTQEAPNAAMPANTMGKTIHHRNPHHVAHRHLAHHMRHGAGMNQPAGANKGGATQP